MKETDYLLRNEKIIDDLKKIPIFAPFWARKEANPDMKNDAKHVEIPPAKTRYNFDRS